MIGTGLAGACAAMALREGGAEVEVIARAPGASALGGGTVDFAGVVPLPGAVPARRRSGAWLSPAERVAALLERNPHHPYHRLIDPGAEDEALAGALRRFSAWFAGSGAEAIGRPDRSLLVSDTQGAIRVGDAALGPVAAGSLDEVDEVALVAFPGLTGWDPGAVGERLAAESLALLSRGLRVTQLEPRWPEAWCDAARTPARLAALLDDPGALPASREALRERARRGGLLLVPPVLGLDPKNALREALGEALGCVVAECAGLPPLHLAGLRLQRALEDGLDRAGVRRTRAAVLALRPADGATGHRLELAEDPEAPAASRTCDVVVLAPGRFVGGGLLEGEAGLEEPLRGLPLGTGDGRRFEGSAARAATAPDYFAPQPLYRVGVWSDARLRPLGAAGTPRSPRLYVAGEFLAGFDPAADRSGHGVALLSGMRAAEEALRGAGDLA